LSADYLQALIAYKKLLEQRNALLKSFAETGRKDASLLDIIDEQIIPMGDTIFENRKTFLLSFLPAAKKMYAEIAGSAEYPEIIYDSSLLHQSMSSLLANNRQKDFFAQRTSEGVHKDDLEINMGGQAFKQIASQGQRKSLLFALKLTECEVLKKEKSFTPILLLDDVFEKLDEDRISNLLQAVCNNEGQVFITDTSIDRLSAVLNKLEMPFQSILL
jgi:DNA replication and repair protein RecF